jgi:archaellum component FlaC
MKDEIKTIEDFAMMIQRIMASKEDIKEVKEDISGVKEDIKGINTRLDGIDSYLNNLDAWVGRIEADVHVLREEMVHRQEFQDALDRIKYIEKKLGIQSGV